jgi:hypothetical protein
MYWTFVLWVGKIVDFSITLRLLFFSSFLLYTLFILDDLNTIFFFLFLTQKTLFLLFFILIIFKPLKDKMIYLVKKKWSKFEKKKEGEKREQEVESNRADTSTQSKKLASLNYYLKKKYIQFERNRSNIFIKFIFFW